MKRLPIATDAFMFLVPLGIFGLIFWAFDWECLSWINALLFVFVAYFFRDPERVAPVGDDLFVSPADGKVVAIDTAYESPDHPDGSICISIFLSIFNVHIQRVPIAGSLRRKFYNRGKFLAAWDHKASLDNEQNLIVLDTKLGPVGVKQIAGLIARRIICWSRVGDSLEKGDRFGLIRFGSRVDLILPPETEIISKIGDTVKGGETVMARARV